MLDSQKPQYVVFQRPDSPNYWVRFSIPGQGQKRIGLKTPDITEAARRAEREYQRALWSAEEGILPGKTSFDKVARQYLASAKTAAGTCWLRPATCAWCSQHVPARP